MLLIVHVLYPGERAEGRGIDQDIDAAKALRRRIHQSLHVLGLGHIAGMQALHRESFALGGSHGALGCPSIDVGAQYLGTMTGEHQRASLSDAAAEAGDDGDFVLKAI